MTRGHVEIARSSLAMTSSDGRDILRFGESGSTTLMLPERRIFIKRSIAIDRVISIRWPRFALIFISPWRCVELPRAPDLHQTAAASGSQQIKIGRQRSTVSHDQGSRSLLDSGPIAPRSGVICRGLEATMPPSEIAPTTAYIRSHDRIKWPKILSEYSL